MNNTELRDIKFFSLDTGEEIMGTNPAVASVEYTLQETFPNKNEGAYDFRNHSYSGTLSNVVIGKGLRDMFPDKNQKYTLVAEEFQYPRGNKLPKKKRVRNKWKKKYHKEIVLKDVEIY